MISINNKKDLKIYTDGAARGNPGPAASAFLLVQDNKIVFSDVQLIGESTNNSAEYHAIINALTYAKKFYKGNLKLYSDSNLAIQQIRGVWKINYPHLAKLQKKVLELSNSFEKVEFIHIERNNSFIQECDALCNKKLDGHF